MPTHLEIKTEFGVASLETFLEGSVENIGTTQVISEYKNLFASAQSVKLNILKDQTWSFEFRFIPDDDTELSPDCGQFLFAYLLESEFSHGHIAFREDEWLDYKGFIQIKNQKTSTGFRYQMTAIKNTQITLAMSFASKKIPHTSDDVDTWFAVDSLLPS